MIEMNEKVLGEKYSYFVNTLLFAFPIVINSVKVAGDLVLAILAIAGIFIAISHKASPFLIKELRLFSWLTLGYFLVVCISILFSGKSLELAHYASRELVFLFAPFVGLAIYKAKVNMRYLLLGIKIGLIVTGVIVINQYLDGVIRPSGVMHHEGFGGINVVLMFLAVSHYFDEVTLDRIFSVVAFSVGSIIMLVNGTRGAWLVFLVLTAIYSFFIYKKYLTNNKKAKITYLMTIFIILAGIGSVNIVQDRIKLAANEVSLWIDGGKITTSVGLRLDMWRSGANLIDNLPLTGYGYRNTNILASQYASNGGSKKLIANFNHLHNDYLTHLIAMGFLGLILVLALLLAPLIVFVKNLKANNLPSNSLMGFFLCVAYAIIGLTTMVFGSVFMNALYVLFMAVLLPKASQINKQGAQHFD